MNLSVVVPVYNEAEALTELFQRLVAVCERYVPYEIIAVDDGSTDGSGVLLEELGALYPQLRLVTFEANAGKSDALAAGFDAAYGKWVATIDADLQNPPEELPRLIDALGPHALAAGRRVKRNDTVIKHWVSRLANGVRGSLLSDSSNDSACGMKVFRRDALRTITMYKGMHRFFPALLIINGFEFVEVEIRDDRRKYGTSKFGTFSRGIMGFFDMLAVFWMRKRRLTYEIRSTDARD